MVHGNNKFIKSEIKLFIQSIKSYQWYHQITNIEYYEIWSLKIQLKTINKYHENKSSSEVKIIMNIIPTFLLPHLFQYGLRYVGGLKHICCYVTFWAHHWSPSFPFKTTSHDHLQPRALWHLILFCLSIFTQTAIL